MSRVLTRRRLRGRPRFAPCGRRHRRARFLLPARPAFAGVFCRVLRRIRTYERRARRLFGRGIMGAGRRASCRRVARSAAALSQRRDCERRRGRAVDAPSRRNEARRRRIHAHAPDGRPRAQPPRRPHDARVVRRVRQAAALRHRHPGRDRRVAVRRLAERRRTAGERGVDRQDATDRSRDPWPESFITSSSIAAQTC